MCNSENRIGHDVCRRTGHGGLDEATAAYVHVMYAGADGSKSAGRDDAVRRAKDDKDHGVSHIIIII